MSLQQQARQKREQYMQVLTEQAPRDSTSSQRALTSMHNDRPSDLLTADCLKISNMLQPWHSCSHPVRQVTQKEQK